MHEIANLVTVHNFCYECARELLSFPVDQKYEIINEKDKNGPIITTMIP